MAAAFDALMPFSKRTNFPSKISSFPEHGDLDAFEIRETVHKASRNSSLEVAALCGVAFGEIGRGLYEFMFVGGIHCDLRTSLRAVACQEQRPRTTTSEITTAAVLTKSVTTSVISNRERKRIRFR